MGFWDSPIGILIFAIIAAFLVSNLPMILFCIIIVPFAIFQVIYEILFEKKPDQNTQSSSYSQSYPSSPVNDDPPTYRNDEKIPDYGPSFLDTFKGYFD